MDRSLLAALGIAASLHVGAFVLGRGHVRTGQGGAESPRAVEWIEIAEPGASETQAPPSFAPEPRPDREALPPSGALARIDPARRGTKPLVSPTTPESSAEQTGPGQGGSGEPGTGTPASAGTAGVSTATGAGVPKGLPPLIGASGKYDILLPPSGPAPSKAEALTAKLDKDVKATLDERDRDLGFGAGGPIASAAHDAAMTSNAPETGNATFEVDTNALGSVVAVRVVSSSSDLVGWQAVGAALRAALAGKVLKVAKDAKGMRITVAIEAAMRLPSGATDLLTAAPEGIGVGGKFDLSDIGAKKRRVVRVRLVEERRL